MKALLSIAAIAASILTAAPASAIVLDFENVSTDWQGFINNGYADFNWNNFVVAHRHVYPGSGYDRGAISGDHVAANAWGDPAFIEAITGTFSFDGAWFTSAWDNGNVLLIEGFSDDDAFADFSLNVTLNTQTPLFVDVNWSGLKSLRFSTSSAHFAMDDLRLNEGPAIEVSEPLTLGLLGMGLLGVAGARRRRKD